jgi:TolB-like protein/Tfp pilus assembly protein PilF
MNIFEELKRRNVIRVAAAYLIIGWLLAQVSTTLEAALNLPPWFDTLIVTIMLIGFPIALIISWVYELTPEGIKKEKDIKSDDTITHETSKKLNYITLVAAIAVAGMFIWQQFGDKGMVSKGEVMVKTSVTPAEAGTSASITEKPMTTTTNNKSIAVLPFVNMSSDEEQEYFSDGLTEEILNSLVKLKGLKVAGRTSSFAFKGKNQDLRVIGEILGVKHILEGSVRRAGNKLRITAQLIQAEDGFHLWSETYDKELVDVFAIQEQIANSIGEVLALKLNLNQQFIVQQTNSIESYDIYLKAKDLLRKRENLDQAESYFQQVTQSNPDYAPAWGAWALTLQVNEKHNQAYELAKRALILAPNNLEALNALAATLRDSWEWEQAAKVFEQAMKIDPYSAELLEDYAEFLGMTGQSNLHLKTAETGHKLDPLHGPMTFTYAEALWSNGRLAEAIKVVEDFKKYKNNTYANWYLADFHLFNDEVDTAFDYYQKALYQKSSVHSEGLNLLKELISQPQNQDLLKAVYDLYQEASGSSYSESSAERHVINGAITYVLLYIGEVDFIINLDITRFKSNGFENTERLFSPSYKPVRKNARFIEYLNLLKLPEYWDKTTWPKYCKRTQESIVCE